MYEGGIKMSGKCVLLKKLCIDLNIFLTKQNERKLMRLASYKTEQNLYYYSNTNDWIGPDVKSFLFHLYYALLHV